MVAPLIVLIVRQSFGQCTPNAMVTKGSMAAQIPGLQLTSAVVSSKNTLMSFTVCMAIVVIMEVAV